MAKKGETSVGSGKREHQKLKPYLVLQILLHGSDIDHPMTAEEVCKRLMAWGIEAERRSIYDDVKEINYASWLLAHRGKGKSLDDAVEAIENDKKYGKYKLIAKNPKKGFYVQPRQYSYQEIRLLAESVYCAKFLTKTNSDNLIDFLCDFVSDDQAKKIRREVILTDRVKTNNDSVLTNLQQIEMAMAKELDGTEHEPEKISFKYLSYTLSGEQVERKQGVKHVVSPYQLLINDSNYYLLAYVDKTQRIQTFRVDRMKDVRRLDEPREGIEAFRAINLKDYTKRTFSMYDGEERRVTIQFTQSLFNTVYERFGKEEVSYRKIDDHHFIFSAKVKITDQFFGWLLGFGTSAQLQGDQEVVDRFVTYLDKIRKKYQQ